jgi:exopolysaccharide biosynthesis polyprenyl glycosylphosphotransferase
MTAGVHERNGLALGLPPAVRRSTRDRSDAPLPGWRTVDALLAVGILGCVLIAGNLDGDRMPRGVEGLLAIQLTLKNVLLLTAFGLIWPAVLTACGLYSPARLRSGQGEWPRLVLASLIGYLLAMTSSLTSASGALRPEYAFFFATAVALSTGALRGTVRTAQRASRAARRQQIVIIGSGGNAARLYRELQGDPFRKTNVVGFVDTEPRAPLVDMGVAHLGRVEDLEDILIHSVVDDVLIGLPIKSCYEEIRQIIATCARVGVPASYSAEFFGDSSANTSHVSPVFSLSEAPSPDRLALKRVMDVACALILLTLLAPVMLLVALAIKLTSPGPVLFAQVRYGYMKRLFRAYKFRTMVVDAERLQVELEQRNEASGPVFKIRKDPRITPIGRFLRRSSLDELPQLWNVLVGDMSLVGPRPLPVRDVGRFAEPWLMRRFSMPPGLTCLWQISGRSDIGFERWISLDLDYIDRWSLGLDLKILMLTLPAVITGRGAS